MIYLDHGATSFHKPPQVAKAVAAAMATCANPGRGGYHASMEATRRVYRCRERAGAFFDCEPEQVVFTANCTQGLNMAIRTLVRPGDRVVVSGFEHNAVMRPLYALGARITVAGKKLFDWEDTLCSFEDALRQGQDVAVFTHISNVFGYILPVEEMGALCRRYGVPFILDAAQSAGSQEVKLRALGADFIAMPGHKGLLGPQGTGLLLCNRNVAPLIYGGTGGDSTNHQMPADLPERGEAGTLNVPGIAGLEAGLQFLESFGLEKVRHREARQVLRCARGLEKMGLKVYCGDHQGGTLSFVSSGDCETLAQLLGQRGIAVRAGLHCAPLAHISAGTLDSGTVRLSYGYEASDAQTDRFLQAVEQLKTGKHKIFCE